MDDEQPSRSRPIVVFDVDDVMVNLREPMATALCAVTGRAIPWREWTTYDLSQVYGLTTKRCIEAFLEHKVLEHAKLEPYAAQCVARARALGYATAAVTARRWHPRGLALTEQLFAHHRLAIDHLRVVALGESKWRALASLPGRVLYVIEDNPAHVDAAQALGVPAAVLMERPWNTAIPSRYRVANLAEFADMLLSPKDLLGGLPV